MKKGFTLIELLAVIVILAIIALIATPIVLNIISNTKENAQLRSAEMYLDAVEQSVMREKMENTSFKPNKCEIKDKKLYCNESTEELKVEVDGEKPDSGEITFTEGKIEEVTLTYSNGKTVVKENNKLVYGKAKVWTLTKAEGNTEKSAEIGDTITIKSENFYVYSNKDGYIKAIAKYNLYVGGEYNTSWTAYDTTVEGYGLQHIDMKGYVSGQTVKKGTTAYSSSSAYVGSIVEGYVNTYKTKLESMGATFVDNLDDVEDPDDQLAASGVRLITKKELEELGCSSHTCSSAQSFITETTYWSGSANDSNGNVWIVNSYGYFGSNVYSYRSYYGVRPIITILESSI